MKRVCRSFFAAALLVAQAVAAKDVEFRLDKPDAQSVALMCECKDWKAQSMTKGSDGVWTLTVSLSAGTYGYKFLVNGSDWLFDPKNSNRKSVNGVENSAIDVTEEAAAANSAPAVHSAALPSASAAEAHGSPAKAASSSATAVSGAGGTLTPNPGEILTLEVPLSQKRRADGAKEENPRLTDARMAISVPPGFDAQKPWPIFVVCNTEGYSNIDSLRQFKDAAVAEGWVIMAADAVGSDTKNEGSPRWPTIAAAFDYITASWPAAKDWPVAVGGMSGGGKNSAFLAADLAREHHRILGILMMGCNQDMATVAYRKSAPPNFLNTAIFLSSGKSDKIATPAQHEHVRNSLRSTGFQKVRLETFDGAHDIYQPHIGEALRWFLAESPKSSTSSARNTDWDRIFKKRP